MSLTVAFWLSAVLFAAAASWRAIETWSLAPQLIAASNRRPRSHHPGRVDERVTIAAAGAVVLASSLALLVVGTWTLATRVLVVLISASAIWLDRRTSLGRTGADQWTWLLGVPLMAAALAPNEQVRQVALVFVAGQWALCFLTAGFTKLANPQWRSGVALRRVATTATYGGPLAARARQLSPPWFRALARLTIGFEIAIPAILLLDGPALIAGVAVCLGFHLATAVVMGLREFPLAFAPAYPAVIYVATML